MRPEKTESLCHNRCDMIKILPCSKALSIGLNCTALQFIGKVTFPNKLNILERDVQQ
jgi:hypothetical protein